MTIRHTTEADWHSLKTVRLAALLDAPTAFGVSHREASGYTDEQWTARAAGPHPAFWLAFQEGEAVGMVGSGVSSRNRYDLIAMWVAPPARGSGIAGRLIDAVKAHAVPHGHERIYLDVAPENLRAARFYRKHGFAFIDEWEPLASHPQIQVQTMYWKAGA